MIISHPEKVLFPDDGITKGELAAYYESVAPVILPHVRGRPLTMERYPRGIDKKGFWQKDVSKGFPEWLQRVECRRKTASVHYPLVTDARIAAVGGQPEHDHAARLDRRARRTSTTRTSASSISIRRDDDPAAVRAAALGLRDLLDELGLPSWVKTSGSKGFHIVVPLDGKTTMGEVARFANAVGALFVSRGADASHAGVQQGRPRRPHLRRHRPQRLRRHVRRRVYRARQTRRARLGAVHVGRDRARQRRRRKRSR